MVSAEIADCPHLRAKAVISECPTIQHSISSVPEQSQLILPILRPLVKSLLGHHVALRTGATLSLATLLTMGHNCPNHASLEERD